MRFPPLFRLLLFAPVPKSALACKKLQADSSEFAPFGDFGQ